MKRSLVIVSLVLPLLGCKGSTETTTSTTASTTSAVQEAPPPPTTTTAAAATVPPAAAPTTGAIASQDTNWPGITAEVTEFRRKGNTLTAKVRFVNKGSEETQVEVQYPQVYLIDTAAGKKYQALKDEKDEYIAALNQGWHDRWFQHVKPGQPVSIWVKFPAPPAEVKAITLQIPKTPPFEDVAIQE